MVGFLTVPAFMLPVVLADDNHREFYLLWSEFGDGLGVIDEISALYVDFFYCRLEVNEGESEDRCQVGRCFYDVVFGVKLEGNLSF